MFILKSIVTSAVVVGSMLVQQATMAYPKAPRTLELQFLSASVTNFYGAVTPDLARYIEEQYDLKSPSTELMLSGGYTICDGIKMANNEGISSQTLIEREIANISQMSNSLLQQQRMQLSEDQIVIIYNTAKDYLCPTLN